MSRDRAHEILLRALDAAGLAVEDVGDHRWMTMLSGQWKRTIPVMLDLGERTLRLTSLFCAAPDQGHEEVYRILLTRNQRTPMVHFALDDVGDVILTGAIGLDALDEGAVDQLLGAVLVIADETYNQVLRAGFADYIAHEQGWRAANELPPNPVSDAP